MTRVAGGRVRHWYGEHKETIISIGIIVLILAGLIIAWGGGTKVEGENRQGSSVSLIAPIVNMTPPSTERVKNHEDFAAERTLWEQVSYNQRVEATRHRASRSRRVTVHRGDSMRDTGSTGGGDLPPKYVQMCESGGDYTAQNKRSSASGGWQITDGTWGGYGGYAHAKDAPRDVQDERARQIWRNGAGRGAWASCL